MSSRPRLVYKVSSRIVKNKKPVTQRNPVSKNPKQTKIKSLSPKAGRKETIFKAHPSTGQSKDSAAIARGQQAGLGQSELQVTNSQH